MACPPISTGSNYLQSTLAHVDCQAQSIGGFGYGALAEPGSTVSLALTGILVVFVALFGIRIALGNPVAGRDLASHFIRLVIVLTLATSWPAWRTVGYDLVISGPAEISQSVGRSADLPGSNGDLASRLQRIDDGLAFLNERGTGRRGVQQGDWFQLGFARSAFLTGTIGALAMIRLSGGILLAIAPLIAGLLLFGATRAIFIGWARGLVAVFLASIAVALALAVELALLEPWLQGVVRLRLANRETLGAPVEALTLTLAFAVISFGLLVLSVWIAFHTISRSQTLLARLGQDRDTVSRHFATATTTLPAPETQRAHLIAASVSRSLERDERLGRGARLPGRLATAAAGPNQGTGDGTRTTLVSEPLGSSYRRTSLRGSRQGTLRDQAG